jgi:uncharacterized protein
LTVFAQLGAESREPQSNLDCASLDCARYPSTKLHLRLYSVARMFPATAHIAGRQIQAALFAGISGVLMCCNAHASDCNNPSVPAMAVICSDPALIKAREERQQTLKEARARLIGERRHSLLADETRWLRSYPQSCGLSNAAKPPATIEKSIQECFKRAIQERITYLRNYGEPKSSTEKPPEKPTPIRDEQETIEPTVQLATAIQESAKAADNEHRGEWLDGLMAAWLKLRLAIAPPEGNTATLPTDIARLRGILVGPSLRIAVFALGGTESRVVSEGDKVSDWRIVSITPREVVLSGPGGITRVQPQQDPQARDALRAPPAAGPVER